MNEDRLVSVIMPAFNSEAFIAESIQSVLNQTYSNWELLIVDDHSTDITVEIIQKFAAKDPRIHLYRNDSNLGTHHTRNKAIKKALGDYMSFLDADDQWMPEKLEKQVKILNLGEVAGCFSSYELISENGTPLRQQIQALPILTYQKLLKANYVGNLTGIYNVNMLGKIYSPEISKRQDWALWLRVIELGGPIKGLQESLALYRIRQNSISRNKFEMIKYNFAIYHNILGYSFTKSCWKMLIFLNEQFFVKSRQLRPIPKGR